MTELAARVKDAAVTALVDEVQSAHGNDREIAIDNLHEYVAGLRAKLEQCEADFALIERLSLDVIPFRSKGEDSPAGYAAVNFNGRIYGEGATVHLALEGVRVSESRLLQYAAWVAEAGGAEQVDALVAEAP